MSLGRTLAAIAFALALALLVVTRSGGSVAPAGPAEPVAGEDGQAGEPAPAAAGPAAMAAAAPPVLPDDAPFGDHDLAVTTDMREGAMIVLRSSQRVGRALTVELATRVPLADGKRLFATVSVTDALNNTVMDCTWRDIELSGDQPRKLDCELPVALNLPLTISGHQRPAPGFIETPEVVAIDHNAASR